MKGLIIILIFSTLSSCNSRKNSTNPADKNSIISPDSSMELRLDSSFKAKQIQYKSKTDTPKIEVLNIAKQSRKRRGALYVQSYNDTIKTDNPELRAPEITKQLIKRRSALLVKVDNDTMKIKWLKDASKVGSSYVIYKANKSLLNITVKDLAKEVRLSSLNTISARQSKTIAQHLKKVVNLKATRIFTGAYVIGTLITTAYDYIKDDNQTDFPSKSHSSQLFENALRSHEHFDSLPPR